VRQHLVSHHFTFDDGEQARLGRCPQRHIWPAERVHRGLAVARSRLPITVPAVPRWWIVVASAGTALAAGLMNVAEAAAAAKPERP
jgi:hypothetical protein